MTGTVSRALAYRILERDNYQCHYCECEVFPAYAGQDPSKLATIDHKHPRAKGGGNEPENLVAACAACNNAKGDMLYAVYLWYREMEALGYDHVAMVDLIGEVEDELLLIDQGSTGKPWVGSGDAITKRGKLLRPNGKPKVPARPPMLPPKRGANGGVICSCCEQEFATQGDAMLHRAGQPIPPLYKMKFTPASWRLHTDPEIASAIEAKCEKEESR